MLVLLYDSLMYHGQFRDIIRIQNEVGAKMNAFFVCQTKVKKSKSSRQARRCKRKLDVNIISTHLEHRDFILVPILFWNLVRSLNWSWYNESNMIYILIRGVMWDCKGLLAIYGRSPWTKVATELNTNNHSLTLIDYCSKILMDFPRLYDNYCNLNGHKFSN